MAATEVRAFGDLKKIFAQRGWPFPYRIDLTTEISAADLATRLHLAPEQIEIVFINGVARGLQDRINPGDRVAFVPPGTPGPYRVILGFKNRTVRR